IERRVANQVDGLLSAGAEDPLDHVAASCERARAAVSSLLAHGALGAHTMGSGRTQSPERPRPFHACADRLTRATVGATRPRFRRETPWYDGCFCPGVHPRGEPMSLQVLRQIVAPLMNSAIACGALAAALDARTSGIPLDPRIRAHVDG